jgi:subtilisin family serine protease
MKIVKSIFITALAAVVLSSCASLKNMAVPTMDTSVDVPVKEMTLSKEQSENWVHADLVADGIPGMSVDKAYEYLKGRTSETVVVGVVDSGTDLKHEDLAAVAWVNTKEIAGNGVDDDKNGYVDDITGWNFIGDSYEEHLEKERILINPKLTDEATYNEVKAAHDKEIAEAKANMDRFEQMLQGVKNAKKSIAEHLGKEEFTKEDVEAIKSDDLGVNQSVAMAKQMFGYGLPSLDTAIKELKKEINKSQDLLSGDKLKKNFRKVVGDNPLDFNDRDYGNNYTGHSSTDEAHGTHVSGIIAASRNNGKGMNGVANNVKIMAVRAVPDGDEYDKDVALAIRYAVDNGAKVINTSFGKAYSPNKEWVFEAIKYAAEKDVLIVNAAGNDGMDIDKERTYPNDSKNLIEEISDNVLTLGAMSSNYNEKLPASFSNYGKRNVDIFAPGVQVYSTIPEGKYAKFSGTSMAAPSAAGVAAIIRSYFPKLSASQVKHIIMNSGTTLDIEVMRPGSRSMDNPNGIMVPFADLSVTGAVVNAYNAVKLADQMVNGK